MTPPRLHVVGASNDTPETKGRTVWDAAREVLAHYEKEYRDVPVERMFLVIDAPDLVVGHAGKQCRPTDAAGLLMGAAHMMLTALHIDPMANAPGP